MSSSNIRVVHDLAPVDNPAQNLHIWKPDSWRDRVFATPVQMSDALCEFFSLPLSSKLSRTEVTRRFYAYARDRDLMSCAKITHNKAIRDLLGLKPEDDLNILSLQRYLRPHYITEDVKTFDSWWADREAPLWVGVNAEGFSANDFFKLYCTIARKPSIQFLVYTNRVATDAEAPCGCYGPDGVCDYHRAEEPDTAVCGCSETFHLKCTYHA
jgi:hypothetical protein